MPAEVTLEEGNCDPVVWTPLSVIRFCSADVPNPGTSYPVPVPVEEGVVLNSYWKNHRLKFRGTFEEIRSITWFTNGDPNWNLGMGGKVVVGKRAFYSYGNGTVFLGYGCSYTQATGRVGISGDYMGEHGPYGYPGNPDAYVKNAFEFTFTNQLTIDVWGGNTWFESRIVMTQCVVGVGADRGVFPSFECSWMWEEL
ncbi:hypothetical protein DRO59_04545 [Candidatus Bathyarchaeota archaeon]|nr:MAG: hypothetical protein DRO59_04545 [Candidatus Bathyarchaeota archaeon]